MTISSTIDQAIYDELLKLCLDPQQAEILSIFYAGENPSEFIQGLNLITAALASSNFYKFSEPKADPWQAIFREMQKTGRADPGEAFIEAISPYDYDQQLQLAILNAVSLHPHASPSPASKPASNPRYSIKTAKDAFQPRPPIDWLIEDLFSIPSVSVVYGAPGSKKTYAMLSAAVCVAMGKPWIGLKTRPAKVLLIDEEGGEDTTARRLVEAIKGELGNENTQVYYVSLTQFNLRDFKERPILEQLIKDVGAELVIIDALADIMPGGDENAVKDTQPVFMALRKISDNLKIAITIIHHAGKNGDYRGSSAISGGVDLMLEVTSKQGSTFIDFKTTKPRKTKSREFSAQATWTGDQFYLSEMINPVKSNPQYNKSQEYVIRYLNQNGPSLMAAIMDHADTCSGNAARQAVFSLVSKKKLKRVDVGGPGSKATYDLVPDDPFEDAQNVI
jgi:hypothetical protein